MEDSAHDSRIPQKGGKEDRIFGAGEDRDDWSRKKEHSVVASLKKMVASSERRIFSSQENRDFCQFLFL